MRGTQPTPWELPLPEQRTRQEERRDQAPAMVTALSGPGAAGRAQPESHPESQPGSQAQAENHVQPGPGYHPQPGYLRQGVRERRQGSWDPLDELAVRVGTTLDPAITAQEVADLVVPGFADQASILLRESVLKGAGAAQPQDGPIRLIRLALSVWNSVPAEQVHSAWPVGALTIAREDSSYAQAMRTATCPAATWPWSAATGST